MKTSKLLKKAEQFFNPKHEKACLHEECIRELMKRLKIKENSLKAKLKEAEGDSKEHKHVQKQLDILFIQRKKGLIALKKLK